MVGPVSGNTIVNIEGTGFEALRNANPAANPLSMSHTPVCIWQVEFLKSEDRETYH